LGLFAQRVVLLERWLPLRPVGGRALRVRLMLRLFGRPLLLSGVHLFVGLDPWTVGGRDGGGCRAV
jgi:hypothetical protein